MSKILIVPDVHGREFWHKAEELIDQVDKVVFLGDYLDPYGYEGISFKTALEEFHRILEFKETYPSQVILLVGNHDAHYIDTDFMDCSRLNYSKRQKIHELFMKHIDKFNLIWKFDKWLFSHAGVYQYWVDKYNFTLEDLEDFKTFREKHFSTLACYSIYRGGGDKTGSCVWADIRESINNGLIPEFYQIVGHTQLSDPPYKGPNIACLDVRRCFILDTETEEITYA